MADGLRWAAMLSLLLFAAASAQSVELKPILDANAANYAAVSNVSFDYSVLNELPTQTPPTSDRMTGTYRRFDAHRRFNEVSYPLRFSNMGSNVVHDTGRLQIDRSVINDHLAAAYNFGSVEINDFDDPDAVPQGAADRIYLLELIERWQGTAFGSLNAPLASLIAPANGGGVHRTEVAPQPDGTVELRVRYGTQTFVTSVFVIDPKRGHTIRECRSRWDEHSQASRSVVTVAEAAGHPGVWFPTHIEEWQYARPSAKGQGRLHNHWIGDFSHVSIGSVTSKECALEALRLPDALIVSRHDVAGKLSTFVSKDNQLVDLETARSSGLERQALEAMQRRSREIFQ